MGRMLRFDRLNESEVEWIAEDTARREELLAGEPIFCLCVYEWADGAIFLAEARRGSLGHYAVSKRGTDPARYIPAGRQPKNVEEAIEAVRRDAAQAIAERGRPEAMLFLESTNATALRNRGERCGRRQGRLMRLRRMMEYLGIREDSWLFALWRWQWVRVCRAYGWRRWTDEDRDRHNREQQQHQQHQRTKHVS